jgi:hypothetical protein
MERPTFDEFLKLNARQIECALYETGQSARQRYSGKEGRILPKMSRLTGIAENDCDYGTATGWRERRATTNVRILPSRAALGQRQFSAFEKG